MAWFKTDDGFHSSHKVLSIQRSVRLQAVGLWTLAGAWSAAQELDGFVPGFMVTELGGTPRIVSALVTAGLWDEDTSGGYRFRNWAEYQPTRADLEASRAKDAERKRQWREKKRHDDVPPGQEPDSRWDTSRSPDTPTRPDPTRPPSSTKKGDAARGARIPEPFIVNAEMRQWASEEVPGLEVDPSTRKFVDYWRAESGAKASKKDWVAAWRFWLRRDHERMQSGSRPSSVERGLSLVERMEELDEPEVRAIHA